MYIIVFYVLIINVCEIIGVLYDYILELYLIFNCNIYCVFHLWQILPFFLDFSVIFPYVWKTIEKREKRTLIVPSSFDF